MDYQALFEAGTLTPQQLFEWMKVDRNTAAAALKQRPELQKGLMEVLSRNSTSPSAEQNQPQSAYSQMQQKSDDLYGAEEDDSFLEGVGKGLLDVPAGAARIGGAIADYGKAGFNELTGNEKGLQWEDTPDLKDVAGDVFQTGIAAVTGGAGPAVIKETGKKVVQNLAKGGLKNIPKNIAPTAGKIKNKIGNTATGKAAKVALGGPKRQLAAGLGVAGGLNALDNEAPEAEQDITNTAPQEPEKPLDKVDLDTPIAERGPNGEVVDPAANQNLDNPNGQMAMTPEGQAQAAMQAKANSMPGMVNRQGGSGSKMPSLAQGRVQAQANFMADDIIKQQKKQSDQNNTLRDRYDATGGRRAGAWDRLSEAQKDLATRNYGQNSFYDSNPNATGGTAVSDIARAELGMPSMEEQRLADLDARVEQQRMSNMGYGVAADPENYQGALPSMPKEDFSKKSGMQNEGTGITQNADGSFNTLEFGEAHENAGGRETAADYLETVRNGDELLAGLDNFGPGSGQAPVETKPGQFTPESTTTTMTDPGTNPFTRQNIDEPFRNRPSQFETNTTPASFEAPEYQGSGRGTYTDQFGQQSGLGEGTVRMSANDQDYGGGFKSREDALGMINRGASLDEPSPEAPAAPEAPESPEEGGEEGGWDKYAPYLAPLALAHPSTRNWGRKNIAKLANKFKGAKPSNMKQLEGNFYNATPIPRFPGQAPRLGNTPLQLPNRAPGLPHRAPGLPNRADPNVPAALPNKSMSAPAGRQVTPEQFRKGQAGMGRSERNAYEDSQRPEFFRKAQYFLDDL